MTKKRSDYIITNIIYSKRFDNVIRNDLLKDLNEKYILLFKNNLGYIVENNIKTQNADNLYIDGFNILFDREMLK